MRHSAPWRFFPRQRHGEDRGLMSDECEVFQGLLIAFGITALGRIKPPFFLARCGGLGFSDSSTSTTSSLRDDDAQFLQPPNWNHAIASHSRNAKIRAAYSPKHLRLWAKRGIRSENSFSTFKRLKEQINQRTHKPAIDFIVLSGASRSMSN